MTTLEQLTEARSALHKLMTGTQAVTVLYDGRRVEFTPSKLTELKTYISNLETASGGSSSRRGPARCGF